MILSFRAEVLAHRHISASSMPLRSVEQAVMSRRHLIPTKLVGFIRMLRRYVPVVKVFPLLIPPEAGFAILVVRLADYRSA